MLQGEQRKYGDPAVCGHRVSYFRGCRCPRCRAANAEYNRDNRAKRGKAYVRNCNLKHTHRLTIADYDLMLAQQDGVCAVCNKPERGRNQYGPLPLAVDHNHDSGQIRGLLCMRCNRALGLLGDNAHTLRGLINYLEKYNG